MSEEPRMWHVVAVAALMVIASGTVMAFGGGEGPPSLPVDGQLDYSMREISQQHAFCDYGVEYHVHDHWYESRFVWWSANEVFQEFTRLPEGVGFGGCYLDTVHINTPWGKKVVDRYIGYVPEGEQTGMGVEYRGTDTGLIYRSDLIGPERHIEIRLTKANFTSIWDMDLEEGGQRVLDIAHRHLRGDSLMTVRGGCGTLLFDPFLGESYAVTFESSNTALYTIGETDLWNMVNGGFFTYDRDRSLMGNGTIEFVIGNELTFIIVTELGTGEAHGALSFHVNDEG